MHCSLPGEAGRGLGGWLGLVGWIKGPPVLHGMINDLQISGESNPLFDRATLTDSRTRE